MVAPFVRLSPWQQDCLRRLAMSDELTDDDLVELLALIKVGAGFDLETPPPAPVAFRRRRRILLRGKLNSDGSKTRLQRRARQWKSRLRYGLV
jgi:hypothetical protein